MKNKIAAVTEFHTAFKLNMNQQPIADIGEDRNTLRFNLMKEENEEYLEAVQNNDLIEIISKSNLTKIFLGDKNLIAFILDKYSELNNSFDRVKSLFLSTIFFIV